MRIGWMGRGLLLAALAAAPAIWSGAVSCAAEDAPAAIASPPAPADPRPSAVYACPTSLGGAQSQGGPVYEDEPVVALKKKAWEASLGGEVAARPAVRARLRALPTQALVDAATLPAGGRELLDRLARDTWRGLEGLSDRENGLPIDHIRLAVGERGPEIQSPEVGDYTNVTTIGLRLAALAAARDLGYLPEDEARSEAAQVLDTLDRLETDHGFFFNYYDTSSLERTSNFLSFVDVSWLVAGLIVTRTSFPALASRASALIDRTNLGFFYDADAGLISHGWFVNRGARSRYHYGVFYTEARLGALLAIGKGDVPQSAWFAMTRVFPPSCAGQTLQPKGVRSVEVDGREMLTGYYEWGGFRYVPSWGGSMFEALMPTLVLDELRLAPRGLGANDRAHVAVQERYATDELRYPVWGMSPCIRPRGGLYGEFGARVLGSRGYPAGAVTPHAAALALDVAPEEAAKNLREIAVRYPVYGEFGFYDAVDPTSGEVAYQQLALDQSMLFLALANHLDGGRLRDRFAADPIVQRALPLLAGESFFD